MKFTIKKMRRKNHLGVLMLAEKLAMDTRLVGDIGGETIMEVMQMRVIGVKNTKTTTIQRVER